MTQLIRKLDSIVSKVVRISAADYVGNVECISCGRRLHWTRAECAHFISRGHMSLRFCLTNLAPACFECNNMNAEKHLDTWALKMTSQQLTELRALSRSMMKYTRAEIIEQIEYFQNEFNRLKKEKHL